MALPPPPRQAARAHAPTVSRDAVLSLALLAAAVARGAEGAGGNVTTVEVPDDVTGSLVGAPIGSDFLGVSSSYGDYLKLLGNGTAPFLGQTWVVPLLSNLKTCEACSGPRIRINGDQGGAKPWWGPQYDAWLASIRAPNPPSFGAGPSMRIGPGNVKALHDAAEALNGTVTSGLDWSVLVKRFPPAQYRNTTLQTGIISGIKSSVGLTRFREWEIANEPDLNSVRSSAWTEPRWRSFVGDWLAFAHDNYAAGAPAGSIQGGVLCCVDITANETAIMNATASQVTVWNRHVYPLTTNKNHGGRQVRELLSPTARDLRLVYQGRVLPVVANARRVGLRMIVGESQGVNMGGAWNVSNVFAAALWTIAWAGNLAEYGVEQLNLNFGATAFLVPYSYFGCAGGEGLNCTGMLVRPQFYGLWAFNTAVQSDGGAPARVVNATATATRVGAGGVLTEAVADELVPVRVFLRGDGKLACVAVNMHLANETKTPTTVTLVVPSSFASSATAHVLEARGSASPAVATDGVYFAGRTFDPASPGATPTGKPNGKVDTQSLSASSAPGGRRQFSFDVQPTTAVVVIVGA